jgi:hypothetical protein
MTEYEHHIEEYFDHPAKYYTKLVPRSEWGDKEAAERYLEKYWLPMTEYEAKWKPIQNQIFISQKGLPDLIFPPQYEMLAFRGGCLFVEEDFKKLQKCFVSIGDKYFIVIENTFSGKLESENPSFRMKYPADISWSELVSGNFISAVLLNFSYGEYFVFGETTSWGRYSATEYESPLEIVGFQSKYSSLFREKLKESEEEQREIATWLPPKYHEVMKVGPHDFKRCL